MSDLYTVTLSKRQLQLIQKACEDFLRTRLGQFWTLANDIAIAEDSSDAGQYHLQVSAERVLVAKDVFGFAYQLLNGHLRKKTNEMKIAEELYTQIRHDLFMERPESERLFWCTSSDVPMKLTDEPRIKIKRRKNE